MPVPDTACFAPPWLVKFHRDMIDLTVQCALDRSGASQSPDRTARQLARSGVCPIREETTLICWITDGPDERYLPGVASVMSCPFRETTVDGTAIDERELAAGMYKSVQQVRLNQLATVDIVVQGQSKRRSTHTQKPVPTFCYPCPVGAFPVYEHYRLPWRLPCMDYERKTVPSIRRSPLPGYDIEYLCHLNTIGG